MVGEFIRGLGRMGVSWGHVLRAVETGGKATWRRKVLWVLMLLLRVLWETGLVEKSGLVFMCELVPTVRERMSVREQQLLMVLVVDLAVVHGRVNRIEYHSMHAIYLGCYTVHRYLHIDNNDIHPQDKGQNNYLPLCFPDMRGASSFLFFYRMHNAAGCTRLIKRNTV
jgi:hypothetical protein